MSPSPPPQSSPHHRLALAACAARMQEQRRPAAARIQTDPLAQRFASGWRARWPLAADEAAAVLCLHRHLDEVMGRFLLDPSPGQVVVLDAGFDCRAWRFASTLGSRTLFEVDTPETLAVKEAALGRRVLPDVPRVPVPLAEDAGASLPVTLRGAGFQAGLRTLVLWEAGAMLRSRAACKARLSTLAALLGPDGTLVVGGWCWPDTAPSVPRTRLLGVDLCFSLHPEDAGPLLRRHGFALTEVAATDELRRRYVPDERFVMPGIYALTARRILN